MTFSKFVDEPWRHSFHKPWSKGSRMRWFQEQSEGLFNYFRMALLAWIDKHDEAGVFGSL
jgi:hypothetical protein